MGRLATMQRRGALGSISVKNIPLLRLINTVDLMGRILLDIGSLTLALGPTFRDAGFSLRAFAWTYGPEVGVLPQSLLDMGWVIVNGGHCRDGFSRQAGFTDDFGPARFPAQQETQPVACSDDQEGRREQHQTALDDAWGTAEVVGQAFELRREGLPGPREVRGDVGAR
ncbi:hypothetical protein A9L43_24175 [Pseudomonas mosselii]|nr:hypothetical protein A9L43_24175 [Pseudomonas mosselii]